MNKRQRKKYIKKQLPLLTILTVYNTMLDTCVEMAYVPEVLWEIQRQQLSDYLKAHGAK